MNESIVQIYADALVELSGRNNARRALRECNEDAFRAAAEAMIENDVFQARVSGLDPEFRAAAGRVAKAAILGYYVTLREPMLAYLEDEQ